MKSTNPWHNRISTTVNRLRTATGQQRRRLPPQWILTSSKTVKRQGTKGGANWIRYRENVLYPHLYPFLKRVQAKYPGREVWLVEDNAPGRVGAANNDHIWELEMTPRGIYRCNWPPDSPDIDEIQPVWDDFED